MVVIVGSDNNRSVEAFACRHQDLSSLLHMCVKAAANCSFSTCFEDVLLRSNADEPLLERNIPQLSIGEICGRSVSREGIQVAWALINDALFCMACTLVDFLRHWESVNGVTPTLRLLPDRFCHEHSWLYDVQVLDAKATLGSLTYPFQSEMLREAAYHCSRWGVSIFGRTLHEIFATCGPTVTLRLKMVLSMFWS